VHAELIAGMGVNPLPLPRIHDEPLNDDTLVLEQHLTERIRQVRVGQQELLIGVTRLRFLQRYSASHPILLGLGPASAGTVIVSQEMSMPEIVIVGAGINGLVAANYLQRSGCKTTLIERAHRVGGACVSEVAKIDGVEQHYALGASVFGHMQRFVYEDTGLASRLQVFVSKHPELVHFSGDEDATWILRDSADLAHEIADKWGEKGDIKAFREDEARVIRFLQDGFFNALPPSINDAKHVLGEPLTNLWISGTARSLLDHYFTSERMKVFTAMNVTESGPVSLDDPYTAFTLPVLNSGSIFDGDYGFVKSGIWRVTEELGAINDELGTTTHLSSVVLEVDTAKGNLTYERGGSEHRQDFDFLIFGTDPLTACRLVGNEEQVAQTEAQRFRGTSGKLKLMFRDRVRWKHSSNAADSDAAFRTYFSVEDLAEFEKATLDVLDDDVAYVPGFAQIYCEGAAMRQLNHPESFDRLSVFFKNLSLGKEGQALPEVEEEIRQVVLSQVENPEDCVWTRLLTPRDMQQLFHFPGGNIDHTVLVGGQTYFDRTYSDDPATNFSRFGDLENIYMCGAGTYPMGSVSGTPGYMCSQEVLRRIAS